MYIRCVCLFSALSRRVGALQLAIIIIIIIIVVVVVVVVVTIMLCLFCVPPPAL